MSQLLLTASFAIAVSCLPAPQAPGVLDALGGQNVTEVVSSAALEASNAVVNAATESNSPKVIRSIGNYQKFTGDGSKAAGWPDKSAWVTFEAAFTANSPTMLATDSQSEVDTIKSSIQSVSASTGVDPLFILVNIMQESSGNVRVGSTAVANGNPGLMQSHAGVSCAGQTPCPDNVITQMIQDGTGGTATGDGLQQAIAQAGGNDAATVYKAARIYNSGSLGGWGGHTVLFFGYCEQDDWVCGGSACGCDLLGQGG